MLENVKDEKTQDHYLTHIEAERVELCKAFHEDCKHINTLDKCLRLDVANLRSTVEHGVYDPAWARHHRKMKNDKRRNPKNQ